MFDKALNIAKAAVAYIRFRRATFTGIASGNVLIGARNKAWVPLRICGAGRLIFGDRNQFGASLGTRLGTGEIMLQARFARSQITIGARNSFNNNVTLISVGHISLGDDCLLGDGVTIYDSDFHEVDWRVRHTSSGRSADVNIGDNVWIGSRTMILKGVSIGKDSVIAAQSVVTSDVPERSLFGGNPARLIRILK